MSIQNRQDQDPSVFTTLRIEINMKRTHLCTPLCPVLLVAYLIGRLHQMGNLMLTFSDCSQAYLLLPLSPSLPPSSSSSSSFLSLVVITRTYLLGLISNSDRRSRVRFPALPDFLSSIGSGTGSTQPL
jgi:hypothetical protein